MSINYSIISQCRLCKGKDLKVVSGQVISPIAGIYYNDGEKSLDIRSPITVTRCHTCGLVQLKETVNPDIYKEYSFAGNTATSYQIHLEQLASLLVEKWGVKDKKIFEIGASNGIFLKYLKEKGRNLVYGVEPSEKLCDDSLKAGIKLFNGYFNKELATSFNDKNFDCVVIRHVLEHLEELDEVVCAVDDIIAEDGLVVVEVPDIEKMLKKQLFSNVFHEHLNYFSQMSLNNLFSKWNFSSVFQMNVDIHGGSLVVFYKKGLNSKLINTETISNKRVMEFTSKANRYYDALQKRILELKESYKTIHGYGASHRTFILMGNCRLNRTHIPVIYDNNPFLHNKRLNGFHSLILPVDEIEIQKPEAIVIFATSYDKEIRRCLVEDYNFKGRIVSLQE